MRQLPILKFIKNQLTEKRISFVPGIGTFSMNKQSAKLNENGSEIHPPQIVIQLDPSKADVDNSIIDYIQLHLKSKKIDLFKQVETFVNHIGNELQEKSYATLEGFGRLYSTSAGDYNFEQAENEYLWQGADLPKLYLKRLDKTFVQPVVDNAITKTSNRETWRYWIPFILIGLLAISLAYWLYNASAKQVEPKAHNQYQDDFHLDESLTTEEVYDEGEEASDVNNNGDAQLIADSTSDSTGSNQVTECIIITGTFAKPVHALRMMNKLEDLGYDLYTEEVNDLTRVGLLFNCRNRDLKEFIYKVREQVNKDAWYLVPEITVY